MALPLLEIATRGSTIRLAPMLAGRMIEDLNLICCPERRGNLSAAIEDVSSLPLEVQGSLRASISEGAENTVRLVIGVNRHAALRVKFAPGLRLRLFDSFHLEKDPFYSFG